MKTVPDTVGTPWIGVDLDGTLAKFDGWIGVEHIGEPVDLMLARVRTWLQEGKTVKIITCRVFNNDQQGARPWIRSWLHLYGLPDLEITAEKDWGMIELWDDRCVTVESNTGRRLTPDPPEKGADDESI